MNGTQDDVGPIDVEAEVAECRAAHTRLFATADTLDDSGRPSLLPGWSVGHVLTHLARNADSHVRILEAAREGRAVEQYAGGGKQRADDIEAGAGRELAAIVDDLRESVGQLQHCWASMTAKDWDGHGLAGGKPWLCRETVPSRLAEVEIHHVDLGAGYAAENWPDAFVARRFPLALARFNERLEDGDSRRRVLSWLLGRADQPGPATLSD